MITIMAQKPSSKGFADTRYFTAHTGGAACDMADEWGATRIVDHFGDTLRKVGGEWIVMPRRQGVLPSGLLP